jgi:hypothetical protein
MVSLNFLPRMDALGTVNSFGVLSEGEPSNLGICFKEVSRINRVGTITLAVLTNCSISLREDRNVRQVALRD